jgi:hypothetical protein
MLELPAHRDLFVICKTPQRSRRSRAAAILLGALIALPVFSQTAIAPYQRQAVISQSDGVVHVTANSPRPLAQILDALLQKFAWPVSYEDPRYGAAADLTSTHVGSSQVKVPSGGNFAVEFSENAPDEEKTLRAVVDQYNQSKNPGRFELRRADGNFYVVGIAARDDRGALATQSVLLDFPITISSKERTVEETVNEICSELSAHAHTAIAIGVVPTSLLEHNKVTVGGTKVPARELLLQSVTGTHHALYWRLLFDPNSNAYTLDLHSVKPS